MSSIPHCTPHQNGSGYRYQLRIPQPLRSFFGDRHMIVRYVAGPPKAAKRTAEQYVAQDRQLFAALAAASAAERATIFANGINLGPPIVRKTVGIDAYGRRQPAGSEVGSVDTLADSVAKAEQAVAKMRDPEAFDRYAELVANLTGQDAGTTAIAIRRFEAATAERRAELAVIERVQRRASGQTIADALIPVWMKAPRKRTLSAKVMHKMRNVYVARFVEIVGDVAPDEVTREHVMRFRDAIEKTHSHITATKHLENIHALFNAAHRAGVIESNPAANVKVTTPPPMTGRKKPFEPAHARLIFATMKTSPPGARHGIDPDDFRWMVKLLAYHGARSGEIATLHTDDVTESMGIPILRIHRDEPGALKNPASVRDIPIHPKCRGIIAYARGRMSDTQKAKGPYLFGSFPEWKAGRGEWFQNDGNEWLRKVVGITDKALTMHSWRHLWRTLAREIDMPLSVSLAIMGHTRGKGEHAAYGGDVSLKLRAKWIGKVDPLAQ